MILKQLSNQLQNTAGPSRVTSCPGLPGTVPEWNKMSRVPARFIPGQWNVPEWGFLELNSPILQLYLTKSESRNISTTKTNMSVKQNHSWTRQNRTSADADELRYGLPIVS